MPEQHRVFFMNQRLLWASLRDQQGRPQLFALTGPLGFVNTPSDSELVVRPQQAVDPGTEACSFEPVSILVQFLVCLQVYLGMQLSHTLAA